MEPSRDFQQSPNGLSYLIDREDCLVSVSPQWQDFASANGAADLNEDRVVGQSLYRFIADPETRHLYGAVFEKVRRTGEILKLPFRCDSPAHRRCMEMTIRPVLPSGTLELSTRVVQLQARPTPLRLLEPHPDSPTKLSICSWCERMNYPGKDWIDVDRAVFELHLFENSELPDLYPGTCPSCADDLRGRLSG